jgi:DNA-binding transcriptional LysR family regulator
VDLHKLRIFVTIARTGGFTRAADVLSMTQPTVSQQLALLETQIGTPLIERHTRRLRLTAAGEMLLGYAEQLLALADEAGEATRTAAGIADRTLRLGAGHSLATYLLPPLLRRYRELYPQHRVRVIAGNTAELLALTAAGTIELALVGSPAEHDEAIITPFLIDHLVVIVAADDPWIGRNVIDLHELHDRVLLTREPGSALRASVERLLGAATLTGEDVITLGETEAIKRSVEFGLGVALVPSIAIERERMAGTLHSIRIAGGDDRRSYSYARNRRRELTFAARGLIDLIEEFYPLSEKDEES